MITALGRRRPSLEGVKLALIDRCRAQFASVAELVTDRAVSDGGDLIDLPEPVAYRIAYIEDWERVTDWPTLTIADTALAATEAERSGLPTRWRGTLQATMYARSDGEDGLDLVLSRYAEVLVALLLDNDRRLAGAQVLGETFAIFPVGGAPSVMDGAIAVQFEVVMGG